MTIVHSLKDKEIFLVVILSQVTNRPATLCIRISFGEHNTSVCYSLMKPCRIVLSSATVLTLKTLCGKKVVLLMQLINHEVQQTVIADCSMSVMFNI